MNLKIFFVSSILLNISISFATELPNIKCKSALSVALETGEIIFSKNAEDKVQPASIANLLTGLLLTENFSKNSLLEYTQNTINQESSSIFLDFSAEIKPGYEVSGKTVMDALLLYSGNDIATLISLNGYIYSLPYPYFYLV